MFALRNLFLKEYGDESNFSQIFKDPAYFHINNMKLSTTTILSDNYDNGGFCPVTEDGYGITYMIRTNECGFTVSSYQKTSNTEINYGLSDNPKLDDALITTLEDIKNLFHSVNITKRKMV